MFFNKFVYTCLFKRENILYILYKCIFKMIKYKILKTFKSTICAF